jgi:charged multivesicular body protein 7
LVIFAAVLFGSSAVQAFFDFSHDWHALRVTWNANPLSSWGFDKMPRTLDENKGQFQLKDDQCAGEGNKFVGQRYWYKQDPALVLLFDKNGIIAGIQTSALKSKFTPDPKSKDKYFIDDGDYWTMTAYFVDPSTICSQGRTKDDLKSQGTGTGLWLQYGNNAITNSMNIPLKEEDIKKTLWGHGKCFYTMGQHYWFNISKSMECGDVAPNCLLYNKGKLTGFCFAPNYYLDSSRYDSPAPTIKVLTKFLDPVPDCFYTDPSFQKQSTVHVYFNEKPQVTSWC